MWIPEKCKYLASIDSTEVYLKGGKMVSVFRHPGLKSQL